MSHFEISATMEGIKKSGMIKAHSFHESGVVWKGLFRKGKYTTANINARDSKTALFIHLFENTPILKSG